MSTLRQIATEPSNLNNSYFSNQNSAHKTISLSESETSYSNNSNSESQKSDLKNSNSTFLIINGNDSEKDYPESEKSEKSSVRVNIINDWDILESLRDGQKFEGEVKKFEGFMLKRRKWPLKGWHKRYFSLDKGILIYAKTTADMAKGKTNGSVDLGLSVISTKASSRRIDIDAEEYMYHIKVKNKNLFNQWVSHLKNHRLYRQYQLTYNDNVKLNADALTSPVSILDHTSHPLPSETNSKVANWILDLNNAQDGIHKDLDDLNVKLVRLSSLLQVIELQVNSETEIPEAETGSLKKYRRRLFLKRHKKEHSAPCASSISSSITKPNTGKTKKPLSQSNEESRNISQTNENISTTSLLCLNLSSSQPFLNEPNKPNTPWSLSEESQINVINSINLPPINASYHRLLETTREYLDLANEIHNQMRCCLSQIHKKHNLFFLQNTIDENNPPNFFINFLRSSLQKAVEQNIELKQKLTRIHNESEVASCSNLNTNETFTTSSLSEEELEGVEEPTLVHQPVDDSTSYESSSVLSISEYHDATDKFSSCSSSSEDEDDCSIITDLSEEGAEFNAALKPANKKSITGRRSKLPCHKPDTGDLSLWSILYKNIGKDLSKITMPVILNEPLNTLQRLCEELEYCELLDKASLIEDVCERMLCMAAFAVSTYAGSAYRAGHKPFNPLLGETYECVREDKGFRFLSEQVSHHPPISACHAESDNYVFWQDMRIKSKFWGKSMEIVPFGSVHVLLKKSNSHYKWNKVTTCVHNIFKGQRWVDQYGEMTITDGNLKCKLTFTRASYWSNKKQEVYGGITNQNGDIIIPIFGKWTEALYAGVSPSARCIWRSGVMPDEYELYYGFTRFAMELNELTPDLEKLLPPTDTRLRPDQRLLEEGNIQDAESTKIKLEQMQRERKKLREEKGEEYKAKWFKKETISGEDIWTTNGEYWKIRDSHDFSKLTFEDLWPLHRKFSDIEKVAVS